jgi:hypothetical protein
MNLHHGPLLPLFIIMSCAQLCVLLFIDLAVPCHHTHPATGFAMMTTLKL